MKENQVESFQNCLHVKIYEWHKKVRHADLPQKVWSGVSKMGACAAAKHKIILSWPKLSIFLMNLCSGNLVLGYLGIWLLDNKF